MYLDTRDLTETREDLKQDFLDNWNGYQEEYLNDEFEQDDFDDAITVIENLRDNGSSDFLINWKEELDEIEEIDDLENDVNSYSGDDFESGVALIEETEFEEYCEEFVRDCGYIGDLPTFIDNNIDWSGIADDMRADYTEVEYQGTTYLFR